MATKMAAYFILQIGKGWHHRSSTTLLMVRPWALWTVMAKAKSKTKGPRTSTLAMGVRMLAVLKKKLSQLSDLEDSVVRGKMIEVDSGSML